MFGGRDRGDMRDRGYGDRSAPEILMNGITDLMGGSMSGYTPDGRRMRGGRGMGRYGNRRRDRYRDDYGPRGGVRGGRRGRYDDDDDFYDDFYDDFDDEFDDRFDRFDRRDGWDGRGYDRMGRDRYYDRYDNPDSRIFDRVAGRVVPSGRMLPPTGGYGGGSLVRSATMMPGESSSGLDGLNDNNVKV